jgi:hypothetical protein
MIAAIARDERGRSEAEGGWTPYLPLEDSHKLDDVRDALRAGDIRRAGKLAGHDAVVV